MTKAFSDPIEVPTPPQSGDKNLCAKLPPMEDLRIGVVGLGYVGLPVAIEMARHFKVVGYDVDPTRLDELSRGYDRTGESSSADLTSAPKLTFSHDLKLLEECNFFIVTVPTPIDQAKQPDFSALKSASELVGKVIRPGSVVVYESTVYPGATEEVCVPILAKASGLTFNTDFYVGYSPERINPGDPNRRLKDIVKVVSGSTTDAADLVDTVYSQIIEAGTHRVSSIRAAEAAKVIENIQRDVNIALINELALLFKTLGLETREVLEAAGTKWNFHPYVPGLVGGHCIGVDPYYLTYKAQSLGFHPDMILAGRRINDGMARAISDDLIRSMLNAGIDVARARMLVMGITFKNDCPDLRNTKVADLINHLGAVSGSIDIYDPIANVSEAQKMYGFDVSNALPEGPYEAIILAVDHKQIKNLGGEALRSMLTPNGVIYDLKAVLPFTESDLRL